MDWDTECFINWAKQIGSACQKFVQNTLDRAVVEQYAYRSYFGILSLRDKYSVKRLEAACALFVTSDVAPSYSHLKRTLERGEDLKQ